jgi:hypothetical protein
VAVHPFAFNPGHPRLDMRRAPFDRKSEGLHVGHSPQIEHDFLTQPAEQQFFPEKRHHVNFVTVDGQLRQRIAARVRPPPVADTPFHTGRAG